MKTTQIDRPEHPSPAKIPAHIRAVKRAMGTRWMTIAEVGRNLITQGIYIPPQSISARIRDLRKPKFGGHAILRRKTALPGLFEYRIDYRKGAA